jgi:hypothetical protein
MKNGFSTTEFWITVLVLILCGGGAVYMFYRGTTWSEIVGIGMLAAGFLRAHWYNIDRVRLKAQEILKGKNPEPKKEDDKPPQVVVNVGNVYKDDPNKKAGILPDGDENGVLPLVDADVKCVKTKHATIYTIQPKSLF